MARGSWMSWVERRQAARARANAGEPPPKRTLRGWRAAALLAAIVAFILGAGGSGISWFGYQQEKALQEHGVVVPGTVRKVEKYTRNKSTRWRAVLDFRTTSGRVVSTKVGEARWTAKPRAGDVVPIRYASTNPKRHVNDARQRPDPGGQAVQGVIFATTGLLAAFLLWAVPRLLRRRSRSVAVREGVRDR